jgi:hypothetical protein
MTDLEWKEVEKAEDRARDAQIKEISLELDRLHTKDLSVGDTVHNDQTGNHVITKIDYSTGDLWLTPFNPQWLPVPAGSFFKVKPKEQN